MKRELQKFGPPGKKAVTKDLSQLHDHNIFSTVRVKDTIDEHKATELEILMFLE